MLHTGNGVTAPPKEKGRPPLAALEAALAPFPKWGGGGRHRNTTCHRSDGRGSWGFFLGTGFESGRSLTEKKKSVPEPVFPKKPAGTPCAQPWLVAVGGWRLAVGNWWLVAVGGGWRQLVVGDWWLVAVGSGWQLAVGRRWRLAAVGGWRLAAVGGWRLVVGGWWRLAVGGGWRLVVPWGGP